MQQVHGLRIQSLGKLMRTDQRNRLEAQTQLIVEHGLSHLEFGGVVTEACKLFVIKNRLIHVFYPASLHLVSIWARVLVGLNEKLAYKQ